MTVLFTFQIVHEIYFVSTKSNQIARVRSAEVRCFCSRHLVQKDFWLGNDSVYRTFYNAVLHNFESIDIHTIAHEEEIERCTLKLIWALFFEKYSGGHFGCSMFSDEYFRVFNAPLRTYVPVQKETMRGNSNTCKHYARNTCTHTAVHHESSFVLNIWFFVVFAREQEVSWSPRTLAAASSVTSTFGCLTRR